MKKTDIILINFIMSILGQLQYLMLIGHTQIKIIKLLHIGVVQRVALEVFIKTEPGEAETAVNHIIVCGYTSLGYTSDTDQSHGLCLMR